VLDDVEAGVEARLLVEGSEGFAFRHDVVRDALALGVGSARAALWHREAARALRRRRVADPLWIADHARRGGELELAADAYRDAAVAAMERFDYDAALELANHGLALVETAAGLLTRARVQIALERFDPAQHDALASARIQRSAEASELAAWAAYFSRDFDAAERFASEARELADDQQSSAALVVAGRIRHARGDLRGAEPLLEDAVRVAPFERTVAARTWLGVMRAHQSRAREALELFAPLLLPDPPFTGTNELLNALMFAGHAYAISGDIDAALRCFARYEREVDARRAPRYVGRGDNFRAWTRRQGNPTAAADDVNEAVLAHAGSAIGETELAARLDLADGALAAGDVDRAGAYLHIAASHSTSDMVYGWRQEFKLRLLQGRAELARDENAIETFDLLAADATRLGVPRYAIPAQIFAAVARRRRSELVAPADIAGAVEQAGEVIAIEAWWLTALAADEFDQPVWRDLAERRVAALRARAVSVADDFTRYAAAVIEDPRRRA
jgi:tetratricopeptide (TPR) repeat protein